MRICFLITTCGRKESCQSLVDSLQGLGDIFVLHDGKDYNIERCNFFFQNIHLVKPGYWRTVNNLWSLPRKDYDYYFMIPDDFIPVKGFVEKTIEIRKSIPDKKKICINTYRDIVKRPICWTHFEPEEFGAYRKIQWVDMCFMCEKKFFEVTGKIPEIRYNWDRDPLKSSGVGSYISQRLHRLHYSMYQTSESMFKITECHNESQMHK